MDEMLLTKQVKRASGDNLIAEADLSGLIHIKLIPYSMTPPQEEKSQSPRMGGGGGVHYPPPQHIKLEPLHLFTIA